MTMGCKPTLIGNYSASTNSETGVATPSQVLTGEQFYNAAGTAETGTMPVGASFAGTNAALNLTIPQGYYDGTETATASDTNLIASNIASGKTIFGVAGTATSAYSACTNNVLNATQCSAAASSYVTTTAGASVSGTNGSLSVTIPQGFYTGAQTATASDTNLVASKIISGSSIFGVAGSAVGAYSACTDNALNASQCSTAASRYVSPTLGAAVAGANGSLTKTIPQGFYSGTTSCSMSDTNLTSGNIMGGVTIFGVTGNITNQGNLNAQSSWPGAGYYSANPTNLPTASQIASGSTILGVSGTVNFPSLTGSNAPRDAGVTVVSQLAGQTTSNQITMAQETGTYGASALPTSSGYNYRDITDATKDDDGYPGTTCNYAPRPTVTCGTTQSTLALRIADCLSKNPSTSSWNGATQCSGGQGTWNLVTRAGANQEVWQDARTGLIWSSKVGTANWCEASGNTQLAPVTFTQAYNNAAGTAIVGTGTVGTISGGSSSLTETITIKFTSATAYTVTSTGNGCSGGAASGTLTTSAGSTSTWSRANYCSFTLTQGATNWAANDTILLASVGASTYSCYPGAASALQPASPMSYCAENGGSFTNYPAGETWTSGTYMAAKGLMGANSTPSVYWRLPTIHDYELAEVNGIRMVMPDLGIAGTSRPNIDGSTGGSAVAEWSASLVSTSRNNVWSFSSYLGIVSASGRTSTYPVRCVGRP